MVIVPATACFPGPRQHCGIGQSTEDAVLIFDCTGKEIETREGAESKLISLWPLCLALAAPSNCLLGFLRVLAVTRDTFGPSCDSVASSNALHQKDVFISISISDSIYNLFTGRIRLGKHKFLAGS